MSGKTGCHYKQLSLWAGYMITYWWPVYTFSILKGWFPLPSQKDRLSQNFMDLRYNHIKSVILVLIQSWSHKIFHVCQTWYQAISLDLCLFKHGMKKNSSIDKFKPYSVNVHGKTLNVMIFIKPIIIDYILVVRM